MNPNNGSKDEIKQKLKDANMVNFLNPFLFAVELLCYLIKCKIIT